MKDKYLNKICNNDLVIMPNGQKFEPVMGEKMSHPGQSLQARHNSPHNL